MALRCDKCGVTSFVLSVYAVKPQLGDYWMVKDQCLDYPFHNWTSPVFHFERERI